MPCTTILVGKNASYDGSTLIARNEDSGAGAFTPKRFVYVKPEDQPRTYRSVLSKVTIDLPDDPLGYTAIPDADPKDGLWAAHGVNTANVAVSATETITSNARVLGADPLVAYRPAEGQEGEPGYRPEVIGGIGEEDIVTIVLPYIRSAREGVARLGALLEEFGTYEKNGIAFQDVDEIWWLETIGGHHWMARRVPDDVYVTMPNQLGIDAFDFDDAYGAQEAFMCSADLRDFVTEHHLALDLDGWFNPRLAFGSHTDSDHVYNTPRAWVMQRALNPRTFVWDGPDADYTPVSDDIPWCQVPERKITVEDVKELLSNHYQQTPFDPYAHREKTPFRPIGISRNCHLAVIQMRPDVPDALRTIEWVTFGSNVYNTIVPFFTCIDETPKYFSFTPKKPSTESFYWANRLLGALADPYFNSTASLFASYRLNVVARAYAILHGVDNKHANASAEEIRSECMGANQQIADMVQQETDTLLGKILDIASDKMRNAFSLSDE
ncbi:MAG: C69 family dipeptidase [Peptoniphilaceae bacterium]|nr:C69 family dipeptidase [Peptoniphilaceae bacterium]